MKFEQAMNAMGDRRRFVAAVAGAVLVAAVFVYGLFNMLAAGWRLVVTKPAGPDLLTQVQRHDNDASLVSLFARHCTQVWATSTPETAAALRECVTSDQPARNSSGMAASISDIDVYAPQLAYKTAKLSMWSVLVDATITEFGSPRPERQLVWWSVSLPRAGGPRATVLPSIRGTGLPPGMDMELRYNHQIKGEGNQAPGASLYAVVAGFLRAYLCGLDTEVGNYVTSNSGLESLGRLYDEISIESVMADSPVAGPPAEHQVVRLLATVVGRNGTGSRKVTQYPLKLVDAAGRWAVAELEDVPAITGRMVQPGG